MKKIILLTVSLIFSTMIFAQDNVGIGTLTPNANAILDLEADDKGLLIPRLTTAERTALNPGFGLPETGMLVFDTNDTLFYFWDGTAWIAINGSGINTDDQTLTLSSDTLFIEDGNFVVLTDNVNDADFDATNELQDMSVVGDSILISGGTSIFLGDITNTTISNDSLLIINGDTINLASAAVGSDDQVLTLSNDTIFLEDGGFVVLTDNVNDADFDATNELQDISVVGDSLLISGGTSIALSEITTTTISNDSLLIINGDTINLAAAAVGSDDQALTISNDTLFLEDGGFVILTDNVNDADFDPTNEIQNISVVGDSLLISGGTSIALSEITTTTISNDSLLIINSDTINLAAAAVGSDDQALSISGDTLFLEDGGFVLLQNLTSTNLFNDSVLVINGDTVNLSTNDADFDPTNELQNISVVGDSLLISGGTSIALSEITTTTISNDSLLIINGDTINLAAASVGSDDQALTLSNDTLFLEDGGFVVLTDNVNDADFDATNELQDMSVVGDSILISGGTSIFLGDVTNTSIANDSLLIINGDTVNLAAAASGTDDQVLTISNDTLFLEDGGFAVLPSSSTNNTLDQAYDQGGPGVGREILATDGAVLVNGTDGLYVSGTLGVGSAIELSGAGTRMFFNPRLAAFRAGNVDGAQWDLASVGIYSFASGFNNTASGDGSVAMGRNNTASNIGSIALGGSNIASGGQSSAMGNQTTASGLRSFTVGFQTTASGNEAIAMGNNTVASGNNSLAIGNQTTSSGTNSFTTGFGTLASGNQSTAFGDASTASGVGSTAMGFQSIASGFRAIAIGDSARALGGTSVALGQETTASGTASMAGGFQTTASGIYSTAFGNNTVASGSSSVALGLNNTASGINAIAMGNGSAASGNESVALGVLTNAIGDVSLTTGLLTRASGYASSAFGRETVAFGNHSTATGYFSNAQSFNETVIGLYNDTLLGGFNALGYVATDRLFTVGNGFDNANRSNALTMLKNGNTGFGNDAVIPTNLVHLNNGAIDPLRIENLDTDATLDTILTIDPLGVVHKASINDLAVGGEFQSIGGLVQNTTDLANDDFIFGSNTIDNTAGAEDVKMFFYKGNGSFRAGRVTNANWDIDSLGTRSFAVGFNTKATGDYSAAMGFLTEATGGFSAAMGFQTNASGPSSTAMGDRTTAFGINSTAMGDRTTASGNSSISMGFQTEATGGYSAAMGFQTNATNTASTAMGFQTNASGPSSTAIGNGSTASGTTSIAMGWNTVANSFAETAIGTFNDTATVFNATAIDAGDKIFSIGNGTNNGNRSNAMVVLKNGNTGIGRSNPQANLHVESQNLVGDAEIIIEADRDNNNEQDNPVLTFIQDGGLISGSVGLEGNAGTKATNTLGNALVIENTTTAVQVATGGAVRTTVTAGGDVGIGTITPLTKLQVGAFSDVNDNYVTVATAGGNNYRSGIKLRHFSENYGWKMESNEITNRFSISNSFDGAFIDSARLTINQFGQVGIATENPTQTLDVNGAIHVAQETTTPAPNVVYGNSMPLAYGLFDPVGTLASNYGVATVTNTAVGQYTVVIDNAWAGQATIVANLYDLGSVGFINCFGNANTNTFTIYTYDASGNFSNRQTSFVVHGTPQ